MPVIFIVSDSIGETADLVARAAVSQYDPGSIDIRRRMHVDNEEAIRRVVREECSGGRCMIVYTLVRPGLRELMAYEAQAAGVPAVDIMGPMMEALSRLVPGQPKLEPGLVHKLDTEYFRKVEAVEFAVKYDDGKDPRGLYRADVILVGVSRSSKTPVSLYLAHRGIKVANVPLVPEVEPPPELFDQPSGKVVGLLVHPEKLQDIRTERLRTIGLRTNATYADLSRILEELEYAESVFRRLGCPVIDVTNRAVEETAVKVLELTQGGQTRGA